MFERLLPGWTVSPSIPACAGHRHNGPPLRIEAKAPDGAIEAGQHARRTAYVPAYNGIRNGNSPKIPSAGRIFASFATRSRSTYKPSQKSECGPVKPAMTSRISENRNACAELKAVEARPYRSVFLQLCKNPIGAEIDRRALDCPGLHGKTHPSAPWLGDKTLPHNLKIRANR